MNYNDRKKNAQKLIRQDRYLEALDECSAMYKENPKDVENISLIAFLKGRIKDGIYDLEPENAEDYLMRGIARFQRDEIEYSIEDYSKAINLDPNNHKALKCRAFSLKHLGRLKEAIDDLETAINIMPRGEYYDDLAEIYIVVNDMETALKCHKKAVELSPDEARLWYNFGVDLAENNQPKEALSKLIKQSNCGLNSVTKKTPSLGLKV